jgi:hypothetical protein
MSVKVTDTERPPRWKVGLYIWRVNQEWRVRLYRPWSKKPFIESQAKSLIVVIDVVGIGAGWWT